MPTRGRYWTSRPPAIVRLLGRKPVQRAYKHGRHESVAERGSGDTSPCRSAGLSSCDAADQAIQGPWRGQRKYGTANNLDWSETATPRSVLQGLLPFASRSRMGTIGQKRSVTANESGRSTVDLTRLGKRCEATLAQVRVDSNLRQYRPEVAEDKHQLEIQFPRHPPSQGVVCPLCS